MSWICEDTAPRWTPWSDVDRLRLDARGLDVLIFESRIDMDAVIGGALGVVAMAGYDTVAEIARDRVSSCPGAARRAEPGALIGARALAGGPSVAMIHPAELS